MLVQFEENLNAERWAPSAHDIHREHAQRRADQALRPAAGRRQRDDAQRLTGGMQLLIENPERASELIEDPARIPAAPSRRCCGSSRPSTPSPHRDRATRSCAACRIEKGQKVLMIYGSANRDAEVFDGPRRASASTAAPSTSAFGIGNHFCLGANLARMEMRVALTELLRRIPDMRYASPKGPSSASRPSSAASCTCQSDTRPSGSAEGGTPPLGSGRASEDHQHSAHGRRRPRPDLRHGRRADRFRAALAPGRDRDLPRGRPHAGRRRLLPDPGLPDRRSRRLLVRARSLVGALLRRRRGVDRRPHGGADPKRGRADARRRRRRSTGPSPRAGASPSRRPPRIS